MNETLKKELERIDQLPIEDKVKEINELKKRIKKISPFVKEIHIFSKLSNAHLILSFEAVNTSIPKYLLLSKVFNLPLFN